MNFQVMRHGKPWLFPTSISATSVARYFETIDKLLQWNPHCPTPRAYFDNIQATFASFAFANKALGYPQHRCDISLCKLLVPPLLT